MSSDTSVKYPKPKILLLDLPDSYETALKKAGFNAAVGTFGVPYAVPESDKLHFVSRSSSLLPNVEEQEIVVVNTGSPKAVHEGPADQPGFGVTTYWQEGIEGEVDPRPLQMAASRSVFDRILRHGGIVIAILARRYEIEYIQGYAQEYRGVREERRFTVSSWSFLRELDAIQCEPCSGSEVEFLSAGRDFSSMLKRAANGVHYRCAIHPAYDQKENWVALAQNKYGQCVAGALIRDDPSACVVLLPQLPDLHTVIVEFVEGWCAQWRPKLFPYHQGESWLHSPRYELPQITDLRKQIDTITEKAASDCQALERRIDEIRVANADWYTLLNGTGRELVNAVIRGLNSLGFKRVIDVDVQAMADGDARNLREDIQIHDSSPVLIVDVKGINGHVEDAEATQSEKHALMRAKELGGNVKPLTIVNHQRGIPPADRDSKAYRQEIIDNAQQTGLGLMTTWDLFRLLRNKEALGWSSDHVKPILYRTGRIDPVPLHYQHVGEIVKTWKDAFGVVPSAALQTGCRLAVESGDMFDEFVVQSLHVDDKTVTTAPAGSNCGVALAGAGSRFRKGMKVFLVTANSAS